MSRERAVNSSILLARERSRESSDKLFWRNHQGGTIDLSTTIKMHQSCVSAAHGLSADIRGHKRIPSEQYVHVLICLSVHMVT